MLSKIYNILPGILQNILVEIHRDLRLFVYEFTKDKRAKNCKAINPNVLEEFNKSRKYGPMKKICYAPQTSMFFSRSGYVAPCYASYNQQSSHISSNSVHDIWFKGSFEQIRNEHRECDLKNNCSFCKEIMDQGAFGSLLINKYEHYAFSKSKYPAIMEFELSNKCNLACIMCDSNLSSGIESLDCEKVTGNQFYKDSFFEELREFIPHLQVAEFTGGDPFMIEEYYKIWDMISELNPKCQILITTNANSMNPRIMNLMEKHKNINFNISIDSLKKENYENIRLKANFEFAISNIEKFVEYSRKNNTHVNLLVCPMTVNWSEMPDFVNFANEKQICVYYHTVVKPAELSLKFLEKSDLHKIVEGLECYEFKTANKKQKINNQNYFNLVDLLRSWTDEKSGNISESKRNPLVSAAEAIDVLRIRVNSVQPELNEKLDELIAEIIKIKGYVFILNKLVIITDEVFFDYLANKSLSELTDICRNLKFNEVD